MRVLEQQVIFTDKERRIPTPPQTAIAYVKLSIATDEDRSDVVKAASLMAMGLFVETFGPIDRTRPWIEVVLHDAFSVSVEIKQTAEA